MSEMVEDAIDTMDEDEEELEEEAEQEVENVLFDITDGKLGQMGAVGGKLPVQLLSFPLSISYRALQLLLPSDCFLDKTSRGSSRRKRFGRRGKDAGSTKRSFAELIYHGSPFFLFLHSV